MTKYYTLPPPSRMFVYGSELKKVECTEDGKFKVGAERLLPETYEKIKEKYENTKDEYTLKMDEWNKKGQTLGLSADRPYFQGGSRDIDLRKTYVQRDDQYAEGCQPKTAHRDALPAPVSEREHLRRESESCDRER